MDAILDTIDRALRQKGLTDAAASKLAVGHPALIKNLRMPRDGEKRYNLPALMKLAEVLDLEFYFGPKRLHDALGAALRIDNISKEEDVPSGFLTIPWSDPGQHIGSAPVAFARAWLTLHNLVPDFLLAAIPDQIEMNGATASETLALLDTRSALRKGHGLWCFRDAGKVRVSHVTFKGSVTVLHPARAEEEPRIIEGPPGGAITILGKVVWLGQSVTLKGKIE